MPLTEHTAERAHRSEDRHAGARSATLRRAPRALQRVVPGRQRRRRLRAGAGRTTARTPRPTVLGRTHAARRRLRARLPGAVHGGLQPREYDGAVNIRGTRALDRRPRAAGRRRRELAAEGTAPRRHRRRRPGRAWPPPTTWRAPVTGATIFEGEERARRRAAHRHPHLPAARARCSTARSTRILALGVEARLRRVPRRATRIARARRASTTP